MPGPGITFALLGGRQAGERARELPGVLIAPVRRLGVHLGVQVLKLGGVRGGLLPAE